MAAMVGASTVVILLLALAIWIALIHQEHKRRKLQAQLRVALENENRAYGEFLESALTLSGALLVNARRLREVVERMEAETREIEPANEKPAQNWD